MSFGALGSSSVLGLAQTPFRGQSARSQEGEQVVSAQEQRSAAPPAGNDQEVWCPTKSSIVRAVRSLYEDELRPCDRILRKRLLKQCENHEPRSQCGRRLMITVQELRQWCEACPELIVESSGEDGDWFAALRGQPRVFVDVCSSNDEHYPHSLWASAAEYFASLPVHVSLPGGRLTCAEKLISDGAPFATGYSIGRVCHIVQLAVNKKILGYKNGKLVPFDRVHSKAVPAHLRQGDAHEEQNADKVKKKKGEVVVSTQVKAVQSEFVTWPTLLSGIQSLFRTAETEDRHVPLSNLRRLFKSQFNLEFDSFRLGCMKLSDLFKQPSAEEICMLQRTRSGLVIVPRALPMLLGAPQDRPISRAAFRDQPNKASAGRSSDAVPGLAPPERHPREEEKTACGSHVAGGSSGCWGAFEDVEVRVRNTFIELVDPPPYSMLKRSHSSPWLAMSW